MAVQVSALLLALRARRLAVRVRVPLLCRRDCERSRASGAPVDRRRRRAACLGLPADRGVRLSGGGLRADPGCPCSTSTPSRGSARSASLRSWRRSWGWPQPPSRCGGRSTIRLLTGAAGSRSMGDAENRRQPDLPRRDRLRGHRRAVPQRVRSDMRLRRPRLVVAALVLTATGCGATATHISVPGGDQDRGAAACRLVRLRRLSHDLGDRRRRREDRPTARRPRRPQADRRPAAKHAAEPPALARHPQQVAPGTVMPDLEIEEPQARDLAAYLYSH